MIVDSVFLEKGLKAAFDEAMAAMVEGDPYVALADALATPIPSTSASEKYGFLGDFPGVKEWIGDKTAGALTDYNFTIANKDWYDAVEIDRNELEDDQLGRILPRIQGLARSLRRWKGQLIASLILNGTTGLAYDGSAFFADRTAPNDNLLAGTGVTLAQVTADIASARAAMFVFVTDTSHVMALTMDTVVVPPELERTMLEAVMSPQNAAGAGYGVYNPASTWIKRVLVNPDLTDANDWYGFCTTFPLKPFILQNRKDPEMVLDDTQVKRNRKLIYSAEMRGNAGYGFFHMGVKVVNT